MAKSSIIETRHSANKSWVELCDDENSCSSVEQNAGDDDVKVNLIKEESYSVEIKEEKEFDDENTLLDKEVVKKEIKIENEESPWRLSYATALKNSANKTNVNVTPRKNEVKSEAVEGSGEDVTVKNFKREIQKDFLQEDLSLTSHLDVFHMQSPLKLEAVDEEMMSPMKETRAAKKRFCPSKLSLGDDAVMPDDVLMPSPKKVTRLSSRRKREPGESPLICKRSKRNSSGAHNTPRTVIPVESSPTVEFETDEQVLLRRQKQIDYGKNTIGYERYCQLIPKHKRHRKHPQTPPKQIKYSRRAWDGLIKQWRQQLHFWDPPSEGGGNIDDLDISSMSEASSDTTSQASSLPATPRDERKARRYSRFTRSSASESSSVADEPCSPLKDD
uniref:Histone RNA hairpin-binding protein RNA-binding domain-containing protein n=1 Tax=Cuerna arida TaxID=1464854 RepID=A0A1B6F7Q2_9HEMI